MFRSGYVTTEKVLSYLKISPQSAMSLPLAGIQLVGAQHKKQAAKIYKKKTLREEAKDASSCRAFSFFTRCALTDSMPGRGLLCLSQMVKSIV